MTVGAMVTPNGNRQSRDIQLLVAILRFSSLISRPMRDGVADRAGFSPNELRLLMALTGEGEAAGHDLAELMGMNAMNVSRALATLRTMRLIAPVANAGNRRRKPFRVSRRGAIAYVAMKPSIADVAGFLFGALRPAERRSLGKILAKLDRRVLTWQPKEHRPHVPRA
jgi:DNA-binding MarR family transcriptional regulator